MSDPLSSLGLYILARIFSSEWQMPTFYNLVKRLNSFDVVFLILICLALFVLARRKFTSNQEFIAFFSSSLLALKDWFFNTKDSNSNWHISPARLFLFFACITLFFLVSFKEPCDTLLVVQTYLSDGEACRVNSLSVVDSLGFFAVIFFLCLGRFNFIVPSLLVVFLVISSTSYFSSLYYGFQGVALNKKAKRTWEKWLFEDSKKRAFVLDVRIFPIWKNEVNDDANQLPQCQYQAEFIGHERKKEIVNTCGRSFSLARLFNIIEDLYIYQECGSNGCDCDGRIAANIEYDRERGFPLKINQYFKHSGNPFGFFSPSYCTLMFKALERFEVSVTER